MRFIVLVFLYLLVTVTVYGQDSLTTTPSPAPSKTPTAVPEDIETPSLVAEPTVRSRTPIDNPFTQDDLNLLVGNVQRPNGIVWHDGELYTACNGDWTLYRIDDTTGSTITFVFGVKNANTFLVESTSNGFDLWIPDSDNNVLWKVDQNRSAPQSVFNSLIDPWGITRISNDSFLITNAGGNSIVEVTESGNTNPVHTDLRSPTGIVADNGYIYFANGGSARRGIEWFELNGEEYSDPQPLVSGLQNTTNVILGHDDLLYFSYALGTRGIVGRIDPELCRDGGCTNEDVEIVLFSDIPAPIAGMTLSDDMRLFLHSRFRPEIYWLQLPE